MIHMPDEHCKGHIWCFTCTAAAAAAPIQHTQLTCFYSLMLLTGPWQNH